MTRIDAYQISVCICTRDRPDSLRDAILSAQASRVAPWEIIVSDDSMGDETSTMLIDQFPSVKYLRGPRRGLGANRNRAVSRTSGTHVLFIDDDAVIGASFLEQVISFLDAHSPEIRKRLIVSGIERNRGKAIYPSDMGFLGFLNHPRHQETTLPLHTSVINATVFPRSVFQHVGFDENLVYGSDESDITHRSTAAGYTILLLPQAVNEHLPSMLHRSDYAAFTQASRLYTTFKLYFFVRRQPLRGLIFVPVAIVHLFAHAVRRYGLRGPGGAMIATITAGRYLSRYVAMRTDLPPLPNTYEPRIASPAQARLRETSE